MILFTQAHVAIVALSQGITMASESNTLECGTNECAQYSVYDDSIHEIDTYKWIESERAGYDLGDKAVNRWVSDHWRGYLRARWLEHLQGTRYWIELDRGDFGLLKRDFCGNPELLNAILNHLKAGLENLHVLCWAKENQIPCEPVLQILEALDINSRRLRHRFEQK